ncbi:MAG: DNA repair protein RecN [Alphaproteobacteria bacterium]|nr:DNA repair protein RecN [Alphaproteobacteria bacterium]
MLIGLNISNIVLIERLNLEFGSGLNILTGETGAGKSILLDALSLALGARSDTGLVRHGCDTASVIAEFNHVPSAAKEILAEQGIEHDCELILRRTLSTDGKSRAWINDVPVSVKTLKSIGDTLVEIHGQFANHTLLNPATHRPTLDLYAENNIAEFKELSTQVKQNYQQFYNTQKRLEELQDLVARSESEREFLEHNISELQTLNPQPGEEQELTTLRTNMMNAEKNSAILKEALDALSPRGNSLDSQLFSVAHILQRVKGAENPFSEQIDALYDIAERVAQIAQSLEPEDTDMTDMDSIEQRLFAIRAAARKHRVTADELPNILQTMLSQLNAIDNSDAELNKLKQLVQEHKKQFDLSAKKLSDARRVAATKMREKLLSELPDLKLGSADFMIETNETTPGIYGTDEVTFMIKTNPGSPFAPLHKSASGGELARLMLALRVVLAGTNDMPTFVFDEVDTGISGATASAVGARLNRLASENQALVITHSAQVAGYARRHFKISKSVTDDKTTTSVHEISADERINEIARIISGAEITPESITMAKTLIKG